MASSSNSIFLYLDSFISKYSYILRRVDPIPSKLKKAFSAISLFVIEGSSSNKFKTFQSVSFNFRSNFDSIFSRDKSNLLESKTNSLLVFLFSFFISSSNWFLLFFDFGTLFYNFKLFRLISIELRRN